LSYVSADLTQIEQRFFVIWFDEQRRREATKKVGNALEKGGIYLAQKGQPRKQEKRQQRKTPEMQGLFGGAHG